MESSARDEQMNKKAVAMNQNVLESYQALARTSGYDNSRVVVRLLAEALQLVCSRESLPS